MDEPVINPYQSPTSDLAGHESSDDPNRPSRPAYALYGFGSAALAAALGSLLAGGIVMALNYRRLGRTGAALHALLWSTVATVLLIVVCMMIPDEVHIPNAAFLISQIGGMYYTAKSLQGPAIESHQRKGGSLASAWRAAGIGILTGIVVAVVFVGILMVMMPAVEE